MQRYFNVINKAGEFENNGRFFARNILLRLPTSFKSTQLLAVSGNFLECYVILRFILEQLSLAFRVKDLTYEESLVWQSHKCIGAWRGIEPDAGRMYNYLSSIAHMGQKDAAFYNSMHGDNHYLFGKTKLYILDQTHMLFGLAEKYCFLCEIIFPEAFPKRECSTTEMLLVKENKLNEVLDSLYEQMRKNVHVEDEHEQEEPIFPKVKSSTIIDV